MSQPLLYLRESLGAVNAAAWHCNSPGTGRILDQPSLPCRVVQTECHNSPPTNRATTSNQALSAAHQATRGPSAVVVAFRSSDPDRLHPPGRQVAIAPSPLALGTSPAACADSLRNPMRKLHVSCSFDKSFQSVTFSFMFSHLGFFL